MKKITAIIAAVIIIAAGVFFLASNKDFLGDTHTTDAVSQSDSLSELSFIQYRIYAPKNALVTLDGKEIPYSETIGCYAAEVKKQGRYTLSVSREGCETVEKEVDISVNSNEFITDLQYTAEFLQEAEEAATDLIEGLLNKCWSLDYSLSEYNFVTEEERTQWEASLADAVSALEENLSAEYTTGRLTLSTALSKTLSEDAVCRHDTDSNPLFFSFNVDYSYSWQYKGDAYEDSGVASKRHSPYILIEKINGEWYIRGFSVSLDNSSM